MVTVAVSAEDRAARYGKGAIWFHWTIAALIIVNVIIGLFHDSFGDPMRGASMNYHKVAGILVLFLSIGRLAWRIAHRPPPFASHLRRWEAWLAHITHRLFYVLMLAVPLAGWLYVSTSLKVRPISVFGLFDIPFLPVARSEGGADLWSEAHELMACATIGLFLLHGAGALKHHLIDRDDELGRMIPILGRGRAARQVESPDP